MGGGDKSNFVPQERNMPRSEIGGAKLSPGAKSEERKNIVPGAKSKSEERNSAQERNRRSEKISSQERNRNRRSEIPPRSEIAGARKYRPRSEEERNRVFGRGGKIARERKNIVPGAKKNEIGFSAAAEKSLRSGKISSQERSRNRRSEIALRSEIAGTKKYRPRSEIRMRKSEIPPRSEIECTGEYRP